jgi:hypothetical protein
MQYKWKVENPSMIIEYFNDPKVTNKMIMNKWGLLITWSITF